MGDKDDPTKALLVNAVGSDVEAQQKPEDAKEEAPPVQGWRKHCQGKNFLVGLYSGLLLVSAVGNSIFFKVPLNPYSV
jgi:hypothetical protein